MDSMEEQTEAQAQLADDEIDQNVRAMQGSETLNVPLTKTALENFYRRVRSRFHDLMKREYGGKVSRIELIQEAIRTRYEAKMATPKKGTTGRQRHGMGKTNS